MFRTHTTILDDTGQHKCRAGCLETQCANLDLNPREQAFLHRAEQAEALAAETESRVFQLEQQICLMGAHAAQSQDRITELELQGTSRERQSPVIIWTPQKSTKTDTGHEFHEKHICTIDEQERRRCALQNQFDKEKLALQQQVHQAEAKALSASITIQRQTQELEAVEKSMHDLQQLHCNMEQELVVARGTAEKRRKDDLIRKSGMYQSVCVVSVPKPSLEHSTGMNGSLTTSAVSLTPSVASSPGVARRRAAFAAPPQFDVDRFLPSAVIRQQLHEMQPEMSSVMTHATLQCGMVVPLASIQRNGSCTPRRLFDRGAAAQSTGDNHCDIDRPCGSPRYDTRMDSILMVPKADKATYR